MSTKFKMASCRERLEQHREQEAEEIGSMRDRLISETTVQNRLKRSMMNFTSAKNSGDSLFMRNCVVRAPARTSWHM